MTSFIFGEFALRKTYLVYNSLKIYTFLLFYTKTTYSHWMVYSSISSGIILLTKVSLIGSQSFLTGIFQALPANLALTFNLLMWLQQGS